MDAHAADVLALVKELQALEFRRGELCSRIEWHLRLRDLSHAKEQGPNPPVVPLAKQRWANGRLERSITTHIAANPDRTPRQVSAALGSGYESTRQAMTRLRKAGILKKTTGGSYVINDSPT